MFSLPGVNTCVSGEDELFRARRSAHNGAWGGLGVKLTQTFIFRRSGACVMNCMNCLYELLKENVGKCCVSNFKSGKVAPLHSFLPTLHQLSAKHMKL